MSSNVSQSYPYSSETEPERASAVAATVAKFPEAGTKIAAETDPIEDVGPADHGAPARWWVWVCPKDDFTGRLHVAGYGKEKHALFAVCDKHGDTYLR